MEKLQFSLNSNHSYLDYENLKEILSSMNKSNYRELYQKEFSRLVGEGNSIALASGRMAFYLILEYLKIKKNDEIIVLGFNCSVMINAILKFDAKPIYSDISKENFGSELTSIKKQFSSKTKVIVAQHSFGIPCDIDKIKEFCVDNNIFLIEDCALTFGSKFKDKNVGNFGDAAIFSSDHSKPINTLIGGVLYSNNKRLIDEIKKKNIDIPELSESHIKSIKKQILFERFWYMPQNFFWLKGVSFFKKLFFKMTFKIDPFLNSEINPYGKSKKYPYPAKMPQLCCQLGLLELENFKANKKNRKRILKKYLNLFENSKYAQFVPRSYYNSDLDIVPLRFIVVPENGFIFENFLKNIIDISQIWFKSPIISRGKEINHYYYNTGVSPNSEEICGKIINLPCIFEKKYEDYFFKKLSEFINQ